MSNAMLKLFKLENVIPELRAKFEEAGINGEKLIHVATFAKSPGLPVPPSQQQSSRSVVRIAFGESIIRWDAQSLPLLFRGSKKPPVFRGAPPEDYNLIFMFLELQIVEFGRVVGEPKDVEMEEIYSLVRRRPDGKSTGALHDHVWQSAALMLGVFPLSREEFEAMLSRLERSCRTFNMGPSSRNYIQTLRMTMDHNQWKQ